jgi:hypothetical protein
MPNFCGYYKVFLCLRGTAGKDAILSKPANRNGATSAASQGFHPFTAWLPNAFGYWLRVMGGMIPSLRKWTDLIMNAPS